MAPDGSPIQQGAHEYAWENWSAGQTINLLQLPLDSLVLAIKTRRLDDLTEADRAKVLDHLAIVGDTRVMTAAITDFTSTRIPVSLAGAGQACGPVRRYRFNLKIVLFVLALAGWTMSLAIGHAWISQQEKEASFVP